MEFHIEQHSYEESISIWFVWLPCTPGSDDEEINLFNIDADGQGNNDLDEMAQWTTTDDEDGMD